jgi:hypothetical protein
MAARLFVLWLAQQIGSLAIFAAIRRASSRVPVAFSLDNFIGTPHPEFQWVRRAEVVVVSGEDG